jgi:hypothetical protein
MKQASSSMRPRIAQDFGTYKMYYVNYSRGKSVENSDLHIPPFLQVCFWVDWPK